MQVSKQCLDLIAQFMENSENLEDLDLSWNNLLPTDFSKIFNAISSNITLRTLNLSGNMILEKATQNNKIDFRFNTALEEYE